MPTQGIDFTPGISESCILERVCHFVGDNQLYRTRGLVPIADARFFGETISDSKLLDELINFIEEEFGVDVALLEVNEDNFGSLGAVARFVSDKQPYAVG
jgi:acyl carrier protein